MRFARILSLVAISCTFAGCAKPGATTPYAHNEDLSLPVADFALTERNGKTVTKADLNGKVWVASFVFTRCIRCRQISSTVARLQSELANESDVRLVTFTVDPARDDPNELALYADTYRADKERWLFLTGKEVDIRRLLVESFKVPVTRNANATNPSDEFDHSTRLAVVDKHGNIRGYYQGMADPAEEGSAGALEADLKKLKERVKSLLAD